MTWFYFLLWFVSLGYFVRGFPQDLVPNLIVSQNDASTLPVFRAESSNGKIKWSLDLHEIKLIDGKILIGSRNSFYVVSQSSFAQATGSIAYDQMVEWKSSERFQCEKNSAKLERSICANNIRLIARVSNHDMLLCGSHGKNPRCRNYQWSGSQFDGKYEKLTSTDQHSLLIPSEQTSSYAYKYSDGYLYRAMRENTGGVSLLVRNAVDLNGTSGPQQTLQMNNLESIKSPEWINSPDFIGMVDAGNKLFIFFKEEALERVDGSDKVVLSRVAQVCKRDDGGVGNLNGKWTSFFKARLSCSISSGDQPFYFNELQQISEVVTLNRKPTVFATFTTPKSSIMGSAVCAFTLASIETVMNGPFRKSSSNGSADWTIVEKPSSFSPTDCRSKIDYSMVNFIEEHRFMAHGIQPLTANPLVVSTQSKYAAIAVEMNQNISIAMLYIGTSDGKLLKIITNQQQHSVVESPETNTVLSETWEVYRPDVCSPKGITKETGKNNKIIDENDLKKVLKVILLSDHILVAFKHCVISVPKKACWHYKCEKSCAQSGNPYCGWVSAGYCVPVSSSRPQSYEQDLFKNKSYSETCESGVERRTEEPCMNALEVILPIVLGLTVAFSILLLLIVCCQRRRKKFTGRGGFQNSNFSNKKSMNSCHRALLVRHSKDDPLHVTIEATSPIEPSYDRPKIGSPQPLHNLNMNSNYETDKLSRRLRHVTASKEQASTSCDDTEWSEEFDDQLLPTVENILPLDGSRSKLACHDLVGRKYSTLSLKSNSTSSPSKIKLGAGVSSNYGSITTHVPIHDSKTLEKSRILTNPNYLPVTPYVFRSAITAKPNISTKISRMEDLTSPELTTFSSKWEHKERRKVIPDSGSNFDLNFPRPPSCVLRGNQDYTLGETKPMSTLKKGLATPSASMAAGEESRKHSISSSSKMSTSLSPDDILAPSYAGSTTSGFVSCTSPQESILSPSSRKAIIVAKGILSAQSTLASPGKRRKKKKNKRDNSVKIREVDDEHIYDEPFNPNDPSSKTAQEGFRESGDSSENRGSKEILFPSPEFVHHSEDDNEGVVQKRSIPVGLSLDEKLLKGKPKRRIFKSGKEKGKYLDKVNDETFMSPAVDYDPEVPVIEGWQEINYNPRFFSLCSNENSHYYDDACLSKNPNPVNTSPFYTMRPKNRMRTKMPKLRNTTKEWNSNNNPLQVPPPALPDT